MMSATARGNTYKLVMVRNLLFQQKARQTSKFPTRENIPVKATTIVCMMSVARLLASSGCSIANCKEKGPALKLWPG